jgi:CBS domain-containing protein
MKAQDIMTRDPACCTPTDTVQHAARLMQEYDCGCLPVVEDQQSRRLVGIITDRDITCRSVAPRLEPRYVGRSGHVSQPGLLLA